MMRWIWATLAVAVLAFLAYLSVIPIIWALSGSLHTNESLFSNPFNWFPSPANWANYVDSFLATNFGRAIANSLILAFLSATVGVVFAQASGYVLAKFRFFGRDFIFWTIVATMMIPLPAYLVPLFILTRQAGLLNSLWGVLIPGIMVGTTVFFMRQYLMGLPDDILEAARVDGASEWSIYLKIVLPLSWPVLLSFGVISFVWSWNGYLWPLVVIRTRENYTIPLAITLFQTEYATNQVAILAMSIVSTLPVIVLFLFARRHILNSVVVGSGLK